ncbi:MAG: hypothetical protein ACRDCE_01475 [Cetobacterium sp.]|uniref:hypothetical protein n=1 Tax=Cetobacterium sp. TaxID=2071632 RepID=UPI003EE69A54
MSHLGRDVNKNLIKKKISSVKRRVTEEGKKKFPFYGKMDYQLPENIYPELYGMYAYNHFNKNDDTALIPSEYYIQKEGKVYVHPNHWKYTHEKYPGEKFQRAGADGVLIEQYDDHGKPRTRFVTHVVDFKTQNRATSYGTINVEFEEQKRQYDYTPDGERIPGAWKKKGIFSDDVISTIITYIVKDKMYSIKSEDLKELCNHPSSTLRQTKGSSHDFYYDKKTYRVPIYLLNSKNLLSPDVKLPKAYFKALKDYIYKCWSDDIDLLPDHEYRWLNKAIEDAPNY